MTFSCKIMLQLLLTLSLAASLAGFVPSVVYVSFTTRVPKSRQDISTYRNSTVIINMSDDTPLVEVKLPVVFPFFGEFLDKVFVSPNGYVQKSPVNLCGRFFCNPCKKPDHVSMIAGMLCDLNTYENSQSRVYLHQSPLNVTTIYYSDVYFYGHSNLSGTDPSLNFGIDLFPDGSANIFYDDIVHFDNFIANVSKCSWFTGIVAPNISTSGGFVITNRQKHIQKKPLECIKFGSLSGRALRCSV